MEILFRNVISVGIVQREVAGGRRLHIEIDHFHLLEHPRIAFARVGKVQHPFDGIERRKAGNKTLHLQPRRTFGISIKVFHYVRIVARQAFHRIIPAGEQTFRRFVAVNE